MDTGQNHHQVGKRVESTVHSNGNGRTRSNGCRSRHREGTRYPRFAPLMACFLCLYLAWPLSSSRLSVSAKLANCQGAFFATLALGRALVREGLCESERSMGLISRYGDSVAEAPWKSAFRVAVRARGRCTRDHHRLPRCSQAAVVSNMK